VNTTKRWAHCNIDSCTEDDNRRDTPLIIAASYGHVEVVRLFLEGGADVQRGNIYNWNALHEAAYKGHLEVCRLLLSWGANVNSVWKEKKTVLHEAAWYGQLSVVKLLVESGADVRLKDVNGWTAADYARSRGHKGVADWLNSVRRA
jgi:ankyrin repeat protein